LSYHASETRLTSLGRFQIQRELGRGGCGVVFLAYDPKLRRQVALKVPRPEALFSPELRARFQHEARAAAALDHPNVVPVYEAGEEGSVCYIASAYCPGFTLAAWLKERTEPVPCRWAAHLVATLADAVEYAHRHGVLHRDLKPANIMLAPTTNPKSEVRNPKPQENPSIEIRNPKQIQITKEENPKKQSAPVSDLGESNFGIVSHFGLRNSDLLPKITDFGLAKLLDGDGGATTMAYPTQSGAVLGTPSYMAPEQASGQSKVAGPAADVYALGVILYELITGRPPFKADTPLETLLLVRTNEPLSLARLRPHLPRDLETICLKCLQKEPHKRYASAFALADDLRCFLAGEPIHARRIGTLGRLALWCRRKPALASTIAVATVVCLMVAGVGLWRVLDERDRYRVEREKAVSHLNSYRAEREKAVRHLYHSLVGEARAVRLARQVGYRSGALNLLRQALALETPGRDRLALRQEAVACMGDFVGLEPVVWTEPEPHVCTIAVALPPQGSEVALGLTDEGSVSVRRLPGGSEIARLRGHHPSGVYAVVYGPRGDMLASGDDRGTIKVWRRKSARRWVCTRTLTTAPSGEPHYIHALSLALTPDGRHLLAASKSASALTLWDLDKPTHPVYFRGSGNERFFRMALSPEGKLLAAVYRDHGRHGGLVWDMASRQVLHRFTPNLGILVDLVFSPDSKQLACAGYDGVALFDTATCQQRLFEHGDAPYSVCFSPDSQWLAIPNPNLGTIRLWNITANRTVAELIHPGQPHSVAFSRDGRTLVSVAANSTRIWNLAGSGEQLVLAGHRGGVNSLAFRADGKLLASVSATQTVKFWEPDSGRLVSRLSGFRGPVQAVAFHPGGEFAATADWSGAVRIWDLTSPGRPKEVTTLTHEVGKILWAVSFSPDGRYFALCGEDGVALWHTVLDPQNKKGRISIRFERGRRLTDEQVSTLGFSPDSQWLAWGTFHYRLHVWHLKKSRKSYFPGLKPGAPQGIAFFPDGKRLAFVGESNQLEVWNLVSRQKVFGFDVTAFKGPDSSTPGRLIALSADGAWLAVQGSVVTIWDTQSKELVLALPKEPNNLLGMAWSPDRKRLAIGSADGRLVIWNIPVIRSQLATLGLAW
jgi:WD40 repeat protein/serine/threonine protein kinase